MKFLRPRMAKAGLAFSLLAGLLATLYMIKAEALVWHVWHQLHPTDHHGLDLAQYQVSIEAKPLSGYKNLSGITFNRETGTLFAVLNDMGKIIELTTDGVPLREISVQGVDDLEGITHIERDYFAVADERQSQLLLLNIGPETREVSINDAKLFRLGLNERGNKNFEGVSWDSLHHRLIVVKERDPKYVISVTGLYQTEQTQLNGVVVERMPQYDQAIKWVMRDLSEVSHHAQSGHLFLLSDESKLLKQFDESGQPMGSLALWKGFHALHKSIPQPEGVTLDDAGNIYVVSEPNLFYVFKPQSKRPV